MILLARLQVNRYNGLLATSENEKYSLNEDGEMASFLKKLGYLRNKEVFKNPFFISLLSKVFNWYSYCRPSSSQFATHYLII